MGQELFQKQVCKDRREEKILAGSFKAGDRIIGNSYLSLWLSLKDDWVLLGGCFISPEERS